MTKKQIKDGREIRKENEPNTSQHSPWSSSDTVSRRKGLRIYADEARESMSTPTRNVHHLSLIMICRGQLFAKDQPARTEYVRGFLFWNVSEPRVGLVDKWAFEHCNNLKRPARMAEKKTGTCQHRSTVCWQEERCERLRVRRPALNGSVDRPVSSKLFNVR